MVSPLSTQSGTCPHGMALGACPICSGKTGGGGGSSLNTPRVAGEMSWNQCYYEGMLMKRAAESAQEAALQSQQTAFLNAVAHNKMLQPVLTLAVKINQIAQNIQEILSKPISAVLKDGAQAVMNFARNVMSFVVNNPVSNMLAAAFDGIKSQFINITDKLAAIYGDLKNALSSVFEKGIDRVKKKLSSLFSFLKLEVEEETDDEELKKIFNLKTLTQKLKLMIKQEKEPEDDDKS